jgi:hypothetical protein
VLKATTTYADFFHRDFDYRRYWYRQDDLSCIQRLKLDVGRFLVMCQEGLNNWEGVVRNTSIKWENDLQKLEKRCIADKGIGVLNQPGRLG